MPNAWLRRLTSGAATLGAAVLALAATVAPAAADVNSAPLSHTSVVGLHNTYDDGAEFPRLANALDAGTGMIELDTWTDVFTNEWKVSHSDPTGNQNNCVDASQASDIYTGSANKDLGSCLDDVKYWLASHPTSGPLYIKLEMKVGFEADLGMGPAQLDALINSHLGNLVYRPADLLGGTYPTLDAAAKADAWPARSALAGKVILYAIPGTVELANPFDTLHTDVEYATYLKNLAAAGNVAQAAVFPSVLGAQAGDPRSQYSDTSIRPWFVVFDGDANTYVTSVDTSWYDTNHYILIMTDAQNVAPALSDTAPSQADAQARVALLASKHASVVSTDWTGLPAVLSEVLPRG
ncbi:phosphatidylinositol-specific phospholipase C domain-containing protein [Catenulispora pinisilvae]|uniref:phosphatidylinositol-specific phospholipase C domain-containing protein n=1 Tax=Catenulispora pinisilvae TaxID=2705253 RepID=UPI001891D928|nr:phosphatidylinositol-specific phospholipase C domain-containing protein [Catenulispora pinisilvae]